MSCRVRTRSRLHFGLLSSGAAIARRFGGVGLMVEQPGIDLRVSLAAENRVDCSPEVDGAIGERLEPWIAELGRRHGAMLHVQVESSGPLHAGLGTGTQLAMAVTAGVWRLQGRTLTAEAVAHAAGRGTRSAIGAYGFFLGGLLVDGGKQQEEGLAPLICRHPFPEHWPILLIRPPVPPGLHGPDERAALAARDTISPAICDRLCRLLLLGIIPGLLEGHYPAFAEALGDYNATVGESFAAVQGGRYASETSAAIIRELKDQEIPAVGQSSWGPTLFAILPSPERVAEVRDHLCEKFSLPPTAILATQATNSGAVFQLEELA